MRQVFAGPSEDASAEQLWPSTRGGAAAPPLLDGRTIVNLGDAVKPATAAAAAPENGGR